MTDRGLERDDAVLTYDGQSRAAGDRLKTIDAALAAAKVVPRAVSGLPAGTFQGMQRDTRADELRMCKEHRP